MNASSSEDTATSIVSDEDGNQGSVQSQTSEMGVVAGCMMPTERDITLLLEHSRQQQKSCQERYSKTVIDCVKNYKPKYTPSFITDSGNLKIRSDEEQEYIENLRCEIRQSLKNIQSMEKNKICG